MHARWERHLRLCAEHKAALILECISKKKKGGGSAKQDWSRNQMSIKRQQPGGSPTLEGETDRRKQNKGFYEKNYHQV